MVTVMDEEIDTDGDERDIMDYWWVLLVIVVVFVGIFLYLRSGLKKDGVEE